MNIIKELLKDLFTNVYLLLVSMVVLLIIAVVIYGVEVNIEPDVETPPIPPFKRPMGLESTIINRSGTIKLFGFKNASSFTPNFNEEKILANLLVGIDSDIYIDIREGIVRNAVCLGINSRMNNLFNNNIFNTWRGRKLFTDFVYEVSLHIRLTSNGDIEITYTNLSPDEPEDLITTCITIPRDVSLARYLIPLSEGYYIKLIDKNEKSQDAWKHYEDMEKLFKSQF